jgi:hypothetical protein
MMRIENRVLNLTIEKITISLMEVSEYERARIGGALQNINHIGLAERKHENIPRIDGSIQETTDIGAHGQTNTHICGYDGGVMQKLTHCCIAVISHGRQEETFYNDKASKEKELNDTSIERYKFFSCKETFHHIGSDS